MITFAESLWNILCYSKILNVAEFVFILFKVDFVL